ncbi:tripartite tricarboxylate transporter substrate binding protein [Pseudonocardia sp. ICBG1293]|uniref:tripartite tricarboxylate transporter substrate binding protein n=1 Tax=Pseudonocardia sp. ICBG1293 TaxID=2844382 RepID=UPI001CCC7DEF|nr:tripartite tricarboxylate transporter substrate binding protein [Pseudonocardia sp. ICBG1293]
MKIHRVVVSIVACAALAVAAGCGAPDPGAYPEDDITFIVPASPGGSTDPIARQFARQLETELGVSVIVQNRDGGGTTVGTNNVLQSRPDGYTIGMFIDSALALIPQLQDLPYEPGDAELLAGIADQPANLAVRADSPWQTAQEFLDDARANPGTIQVANSGAMAVTDLEVRKLAEAAGVDIQSVAFGGGGAEAFKALVGGQVDAVVGRAATFAGDVAAGNVRVLATFGDEPFAAAPGAVPTSELGFDVGDTPEVVGIGAPRGLPPQVRDRLVTATNAVAGSEEFQTFVRERGLRPRPQDPQEYQATIDRTRDAYAALLERTGLLEQAG